MATLSGTTSTAGNIAVNKTSSEIIILDAYCTNTNDMVIQWRRSSDGQLFLRIIEEYQNQLVPAPNKAVDITYVYIDR